MKPIPLPHPADMCEEPCSTTPQGFSAEADHVIGHLGGPRTTGHGYAVSYTSRAEAEAEALQLAKDEAAKRMNLYLTAQPIPTRKTWIV